MSLFHPPKTITILEHLGSLMHMLTKITPSPACYPNESYHPQKYASMEKGLLESQRHKNPNFDQSSPKKYKQDLSMRCNISGFTVLIPPEVAVASSQDGKCQRGHSEYLAKVGYSLVSMQQHSPQYSTQGLRYQQGTHSMVGMANRTVLQRTTFITEIGLGVKSRCFGCQQR